MASSVTLASLQSWLTQQLQATHVQLRRQGNVLHVLCEQAQVPDRQATARLLIQALRQRPLKAFLPPHTPLIYQLLLYGRAQGQTRSQWMVPLDLAQLDAHWQALTPKVAPASKNQPSRAGERVEDGEVAGTATAGSLVLTPFALAKRGTPTGIAQYLSEGLAALGVQVTVDVKPGRRSPQTPTSDKRLWIRCQAAYSPDPYVVAEPVASRLRSLELADVSDAIVLIQVEGEQKPDWFVRVDLTPATDWLRDWARWGDVGAITRLVQRSLQAAAVAIELTAELKGSTLYLFCQSTAPTPPDEAAVRAAVMPLLDDLAPQGIHALGIYGQAQTADTPPPWVIWHTLPGAEHEALMPATWELAQQGDLPALTYVLMRCLNPDLDQQLATGGIQVQVRWRERQLLVMTDSPVCPPRKRVATTISRRVRQLNIAQLDRLRVYGRQAGQTQPIWRYGTTLQPRRSPVTAAAPARAERIVPAANPEFAASDTYVGDLISKTESAIVLRSQIQPDLSVRLRQWSDRVTASLRHALVRSQFFVPMQDTAALSATHRPTQRELSPIALIWTAVGLLLVVQADWMLGQVVQGQGEQAAIEADRPGATATAGASEIPAPIPFWDGSDVAWVQPEEPSSNDAPADAADPFAGGGFTEQLPQVTTENLPPAVNLPASPLQARVDYRTLESDYATFNTRQLDAKLALYRQYLEVHGEPPDVLIMGSSRALRGVDPQALAAALADLGYPEVSVFNFGINGATAQVTNLIIQQFLTPEQLPKLIVWADGARAFNSGRLDVTYNGIVASAGYPELMADRQAADIATATLDTVSAATAAVEASESPSIMAVDASLAGSYRQVDQWLADQLSRLSGVYEQRDRLKTALHDRIGGGAAPAIAAQEAEQTSLAITTGDDSPQPQLAVSSEVLIDFDGFLPLALQFNPATYYQNHPQVSGLYDGDYDNFELQGQQEQALQDLLDYTESLNIPVVFVNTPLTDEYLDPVRTEHEQAFLQWMLQQSADRPGLFFRDLGPRWTEQYGYFSDPSHLNRYGAYQVSQHIAQDPMIPWSTVTRSP